MATPAATKTGRAPKTAPVSESRRAAEEEFMRWWNSNRAQMEEPDQSGNR